MNKNLTHMGSHDLLLGKDASAEQEAFASVEKHISVDYPATYIWCGDKDDVVPPENTRMMVDALNKANVPVDQ